MSNGGFLCTFRLQLDALHLLRMYGVMLVQISCSGSPLAKTYFHRRIEDLAYCRVSAHMNNQVDRTHLALLEAEQTRHPQVIPQRDSKGDMPERNYQAPRRGSMRVV